ncbi:DUF1709-domain-containing protein, partial [Metschnikowia bicuspidata var. bicuspidata NRRL YB-4993]
VDMLLQELNHDGPAPEPTNPDGSSPDESPVKPLNYQTQKQPGSPRDQKTALGPNVTDREYHADPLRKDFNSSSDTYVSDHDEGENLSRNLQEGEEADILSGNDPELQEPHATAVSPSKSIMKSSVSSGSPKKSVVFQPSLDTFHTYTPKDPEPSPPAEPAAFFNHLWQEVDQLATSHDTTASPPAPPPHTSSTITGLLTPSRDYLSSDDEASSQESADVDSMRKPVNRHSSLALEENPDVFLTPALQSQNDDLDNHLEQLEKAKTEETGVNIHRLSYHMEDYNPRLENNPFSALSNSLKLYVNSAHSSQSSLQSLMDSNRQLPAETIEKKSRGIQFNDGIKGFPDTVANLLIPLPGAEEDSLSDSSSVGSQFSFLQMKTEPSRHPDHSYDQSYNLTEKSILNLLTSASNLDLSDGQLIKTEPHEEKASLNLKQEPIEPNSTENNTIMTPRSIKSESPEIEVKQEQEKELAFSPEPLSSDEKDNETYVKREEQVNTPQVKSAPDENEVLEGCDDEYSFQSLAPPRSEVKESQLPQKLPCQADDIADAYEKRNPSSIQDYDSSVLANSSNITPPMNMKLPVTDTGDDAFADLTQRLNENSKSFEESLSAEHDVVKTPANFLSIWHSQLLGRRVKKPVSTFYKVPSILTYNTADLSQGEKYHIPPSLQPKKFTDVNLVSTRVVSLSFEDLNVSAFLPELSQDSGIEDHFRSLMKDQAKLEIEGSVGSMNGENSQRRKSLESLSFLSDLERTNSRENFAMALRRKSLNGTLRPGVILNSRKDSISTKRSKFHVPSFEIKRSNSILSPKNQYNDIFLDGKYVAPTIKAPGMKTLPSLDRDDVKRIMQMKQAMSLEEYSGLKKVGAPVSATQHKPSNKHAALQQRASIYCDSLASNSATAAAKFRVHPQGMNRPLVDPSQVLTNISDESSARRRPLSFAPHGFDQGPRKPVVMSDQENHLSNEEVNQVSNTPAIEVNDSDETSLPDPFPNFVKISPERKPVATSSDQNTKSTRSSPIKISSPVKVVKQNGSVTGIVLDRKTKDVKISNEIPNKKLRTDKSHLSAVSVPSNITSDRSTFHGAQSDASIDRTDSVKARSRKSIVTDMPDEMGKLFFRVVGLKNVNVGEVKDRNAEFTITLDNGIHCIKTPDYQLDVSRVMIDKEFELSVSELLEFILTLKATYAKAKPTYKEIKERKVVKSKNKIGRLFGSKEIITTTKYVPQNGVDPLDSLFATDGSFARCYVDLDLYKSQITGQVCTYNLICYNEWATYTHNGEKIVKQPYPIAQLEVKMLYVPRREKYEILPTSIKSAYESLHDLRSEMYMALEGYLHQEGGDCETWKRRWFKLQGTSLIAHSEYSHKTRAKINLAKVAEVIYVNEENIGLPSSSYRNFSDILLMGNSFKIRFANGETIDFGAPSKTEKALWIRTIQEIVYRNKFRRQPWVMLMQEKNGDRRKLLVES